MSSSKVSSFSFLIFDLLLLYRLSWISSFLSSLIALLISALIFFTDCESFSLISNSVCFSASICFCSVFEVSIFFCCVLPFLFKISVPFIIAGTFDSITFQLGSTLTTSPFSHSIVTS